MSCDDEMCCEWLVMPCDDERCCDWLEGYFACLLIDFIYVHAWNISFLQ